VGIVFELPPLFYLFVPPPSLVPIRVVDSRRDFSLLELLALVDVVFLDVEASSRAPSRWGFQAERFYTGLSFSRCYFLFPSLKFLLILFLRLRSLLLIRLEAAA